MLLDGGPLGIQLKKLEMLNAKKLLMFLKETLTSLLNM